MIVTSYVVLLQSLAAELDALFSQFHDHDIDKLCGFVAVAGR